MSEMLPLLLTGWAAMAVIMLILFIAQRWRHDAGIVDLGWAGGLGLLALYYAINLQDEYPAWRVWLVAGMGGFWSLRLALYMLFDRVLGKEEDGRYQMLRQEWGEKTQAFFFVFFQVQALLAVVFSIPFLIVMRHPSETFLLTDQLALQIWAVAMIGEALADRQLAKFRADPANKGKTCRVGLWRYSRHPNYFFEWLHWWSYVLMGLAAPQGWLTLLGPILMFYFLFKISGIPYTEKRALLTRGDDYREYQRTTSVFIPWFPLKDKER